MGFEGSYLFYFVFISWTAWHEAIKWISYFNYKMFYDILLRSKNKGPQNRSKPFWEHTYIKNK